MGARDGGGGGRYAEGGCLCGAVRYRIRVPEGGLRAMHCHCRRCRKSSGAAAATWVEHEPGGFELLRGSPRAYRSSPGAVREFCGRCGSQLTYRGTDRGEEDLGVTLGSLDDPGAARVECGIHAEESVPGIRLDPGLRSHARGTDSPSAGGGEA